MFLIQKISLRKHGLLTLIEENKILEKTFKVDEILKIT